MAAKKEFENKRVDLHILFARQIISQIRKDAERLQERAEHNMVSAVEIDCVSRHIARIEKHLNIEEKCAK